MNESLVQVNEGQVNEKFSIVIPGYSPRRIPNYERIFKEYGSMQNDVDRIIVEWNNDKIDPPFVPKNLPVDVMIVRNSANLLSNRFNLEGKLRTEGVFSTDDDVLLSPALLKCMFRHWREEPSRLIGLDEDTRGVSPSGEYGSPDPSNVAARIPYSIILTKSMFFSSRYIKPFFEDPIISNSSNTMMNGEDIGMTALVSNLARLPPLAVKQDPNHTRQDLSRVDGLEFRTGGADHYKGRSDFSKLMLSHFGNDVFRSTREFAYCNE